MKKDRQKNKHEAMAQALESIETLVAQAVKTAKKDPELAREYARMAFRIAQKSRCGLPGSFPRAICKKCFSVRLFGINAKAVPDTKTGSVVYLCSCGAKQRFFYKAKENDLLPGLKSGVSH